MKHIKKSIAVLSACLLMSSNVNAIIIDNSQECADYAIAAADAEEDHYGAMSDDDWADAALFYWDACEEAGGAGNIGSPIFI